MSAYPEAQYVIDELSQKITSTGVKLLAPTDVSIVNFDEAAKLTWTDPEDVVSNGGIVAQWAKTVVVRKEGSAPTSVSDGTVIETETSRNAHQTKPLIDTGLTNGTTYYYGIFPCTDIGQYTTSCTQSFTPAEIKPTTPTLDSVTASDEGAIVAFTNNDSEALTKIVYKKGSAPTSDKDGTVIENATSPQTVDGLINDTEYFFVVYSYTSKRVSVASEVISATPHAIVPTAPTLDSIKGTDQSITISFTKTSADAGVKIVYKEGSAPTSDSDGTVLTNRTSPITITGLTNGTTYYFVGYAFTTKRTSEASNTLSATPRAYIQFAFHYSENDNAPDSVTYPAGYDNSDWGDDPFYVDLSTGKPHWGKWADDKAKFLIPKSCMLKYDGTRDYYLDENDETKKADGTASDVASTSYAGNAMMEFGQEGAKIYWKIVPDSDGKGFTWIVANAQVDEDMKPWNHYNCKGEVAEHFYVSKYFGGNDGSKMRSLSGVANYVSQTGTTELTAAKANNQTSDEIWNTWVYSDWLFLWMLCILFSKSTNVQAKYGYGNCNTSGALANGTMNGKGLFFGSANKTSGVKVFGIENLWGNIWRRIAGLMLVNGTVKIKLTYGKQDGSTVEGYNTTGEGYISHGTMGGTSGGYISHVNATDRGITPETMSGSDSTFYCDGAWFNNSGTMYAFVGTLWSNDLLAGFAVGLYGAVSVSSTRFGSALSCKPLA